MYDPWYKEPAVKDTRDYRFFTRCDDCGRLEKVRAFSISNQEYLYYCQPCDAEVDRGHAIIEQNTAVRS